MYWRDEENNLRKCMKMKKERNQTTNNLIPDNLFYENQKERLYII